MLLVKFLIQNGKELLVPKIINYIKKINLKKIKENLRISKYNELLFFKKKKKKNVNSKKYKKYADSWNVETKNILKNLSQRYSLFFVSVNPKLHNAPNYYKIIQEPMHFGTIVDKLIIESYKNLNECLRDCQLVLWNARLYNFPKHNIYKLSQKFQKEFKKKMNTIINRFGTKNDLHAWRIQYGLGVYGPFCYDPKLIKEQFKT